MSKNAYIQGYRIIFVVETTTDAKLHGQQEKKVNDYIAIFCPLSFDRLFELCSMNKSRLSVTNQWKQFQLISIAICSS